MSLLISFGGIMELIYKEEFYRIKQACIKVRQTLGNGYLEKIYERALKIELIENGFKVETQKPFEVLYRDQLIGDYYLDMLVDDKIIIELKCCDKLQDYHKAQLINYLKATDMKLGILINFPNNRKGFDIERIPNLLD